MKRYVLFFGLLLTGLTPGRSQSSKQDPDFPPELVSFTPYKGNPVFSGTGTNTWDQKIRERGYILHEADGYHLWYTGYEEGDDKTRYLGYATSSDGLNWTRYKNNPVLKTSWVEDLTVVKHEGTYYMFAEGKDDIAHLLTSTDRINWQEKGPLDIRLTNGQPISKGPYGTPTVWKGPHMWYLFYERKDQAVWLATSDDLKLWTNVQDEPVLTKGPDDYDQHAIAMNQIIHYKGLYYAYYHASAFADWREWTTNVAVSKDLINWKKYAGNPIVGGNKSSGILVNDGRRYRLYTMHPAVNVFLPK
ncbi:glycosylase [Spirosoma sp. RP8]|uniref:Glycosylase n=1 Tax=Spirosoma liriopis TaxID=2937440 RepID=A0ABT0HP29_9BACT|nr:glycosylase [Spirosoma liriopis]MCK8493735.1 glycosylase [Spirosoma liriopis]